jgi:hypothetical protein
MARPAFKEIWTRWVPWHVERSTFVLLSTFLIDHFVPMLLPFGHRRQD